MQRTNLTLNEAERIALRALLAKPRASSDARLAAKILLALGENGASKRRVEKQFMVGRRVVNRALAAYHAGGAIGVADVSAKRGRPKTPDAVRGEIIAFASRKPIPQARVIAKAVGTSVGTVMRTLHRNGVRLPRSSRAAQ